jgi:hypothetical protein
MKKEGVGKPENPDIALDANVRMRELHFDGSAGTGSLLPGKYCTQFGVGEQAREPAGRGSGGRFLSQRQSPLADRRRNN